MKSSSSNSTKVGALLGIAIALLFSASSASAGRSADEEGMLPTTPQVRSGDRGDSSAMSQEQTIWYEHRTDDYLYIGDASNNTVRRFNAKTGKFLGNLVAPDPANGGLFGPRGMIFTLGKLYVVNQNAGQPFNGEILRFKGSTGAFLDKLVAAEDPKSPFSPRGLVRGSGRTVYLANYVPNDEFTGPGWIRQFDAETGQFLREFEIDPAKFGAGFWPRGIVFGPDGLLYVAVTGNRYIHDEISGYILRFSPHTGKLVNVFASGTDTNARGCAKHLHRPEGLVFGPDDRLYVTSYRADEKDTDKILVFNHKTKACIDRIDLAPSEASGGTRAFGQALLFGPNGRLFVPMTNTGEVRRYNVKSKKYDVFVPACGAGSQCLLEQPWYLTFGQTDPATLEVQ